ncbi:hypothetical protein [Reyranella sp.]|uniref:5' nucleotidase, NT5C type n=1 Tax=Reyranella sp. TaxID=1929291 RepID=UPI0025FA7881|nr:hypothetical protein [Reyranella sp.]
MKWLMAQTPQLKAPAPYLVVDNTVHKPTIYFDLDGVLADFDKAAERVLGTSNIYRFEFVHGQEEFWRLLNRSRGFFRDMEMMPGADHLLRAADGFPTAVLTALPKTNGESVADQKRRWVEQHLGPHYHVITCLTHEKPNYCKPGDILIDDRAVNKRRWEAKGGKFVLHENVGNTLAQLESLGVKA